MTLREYMQLDPCFSETDLLARIANLWMQREAALTLGEPLPLKPYLSDTLYAALVNEITHQGSQRPLTARPVVLSSEIASITHDSDTDSIVLRLHTRAVRSLQDRATGRESFPAGNRELFETWQWTLVRPAGIITHMDGAVASVHCPSCNASLALYASAKCPFCGSTVKVPGFAWVVRDICMANRYTK